MYVYDGAKKNVTDNDAPIYKNVRIKHLHNAIQNKTHLCAYICIRTGQFAEKVDVAPTLAGFYRSF